MIALKNVDFYYKKKKMIFEKFDLELKAGNIYGLLGKNGAGKTTLLKLIAGLHFAKSGVINLAGDSIRKRSVRQLSEIFFMPEELYSPNLSIGFYQKLYSPFYKKFNLKEFQRHLNDFELQDEAVIQELSYGQRKKMHIAFGLATNAKYVLFDEPTNGLDVPSKSSFRKIISEAALNDRLIIISTHQIRDVYNLIDPVIILDDGRILLNKDLYSISEKISIKYFDIEPAENECLFYHKTPRGYAGIVENKTGDIQDLDLEILFNGIVKNEKITQIINSG